MPGPVALSPVRRAELDLAPPVFHDRLLFSGCFPVALIADELRCQSNSQGVA